MNRAAAKVTWTLRRSPAKRCSIAIVLCVGLTTFISLSTNAHILNDHRVGALECAKIEGDLEKAKDTLARSIRTSVFSLENHIPIQNWSFRYGFYDLAACWSMSRFQRYYFLMREPVGSQNPKRVQSFNQLSDQARSAEMYEDETGWKAFPLKSHLFLPDKKEPLWSEWERGRTGYSYNGQALERGFKPDIEYYQALRFHRLENIRYIRGPNERTRNENKDIWNELSRLIARGRKPLIIVRPDKYYQHVVIVKSIQMTSEGATLSVYDSNSPWRDREVIWHSQNEMFSAYDVIAGMPVSDPRAFVGVFIIDEEENEILLKDLVMYYRELCKSGTL